MQQVFLIFLHEAGSANSLQAVLAAAVVALAGIIPVVLKRSKLAAVSIGILTIVLVFAPFVLPEPKIATTIFPQQLSGDSWHIYDRNAVGSSIIFKVDDNGVRGTQYKKSCPADNSVCAPGPTYDFSGSYNKESGILYFRRINNNTLNPWTDFHAKFMSVDFALGSADEANGQQSTFALFNTY